MIIGLLKEIKIDEYRVALVPEDAKKLVQNGNDVIFEPGCGRMAGYMDKEYVKVGARPQKKKKIFKLADLILKVKTPQGNEVDKFSNGQVLFSYLHYDGNESLDGAEKIKNSGAIAIAFEWVEEDGSKYPLLKPMSELTGIIAAIKSLEIFRKKKRKICGHFSEFIKPARIMIIGLGTIGLNALNVFIHQRAKIVIVDKHPETLDERVGQYVPKFLWNKYKDSIKILMSFEDKVEETKNAIRRELSNIDILFFSAVRRPTFTTKHLIDKAMLLSMKNNSVLVDAGANDRDLVETSLSYPEIDKTYNVYGVWHYANDHIPSMAAYDASRILSNAILPYVFEISEKGPIIALRENSALSKGTIIAGREYTHDYTCKKKDIQYMPIETALNYYTITTGRKFKLKAS